MPAFQPIVLTDGKGTPTNHTYDLVSNGAGRAKMANRAAPNLVSQENLVLEVRQPAGATGAFRGIVSLGSPIPVTEASGAIFVSHTSSAKVEFNWAQKSTMAERRDVYFQVISALENAIIEEAILDIEPIYT